MDPGTKRAIIDPLVSKRPETNSKYKQIISKQKKIKNKFMLYALFLTNFVLKTAFGMYG